MPTISRALRRRGGAGAMRTARNWLTQIETISTSTVLPAPTA
ncbi:MAG TPA: hypothetical protein VK681_04265 [Reyranella sp.]|nr:hypothetical protein [Reyranella sp.]